MSYTHRFRVLMFVTIETSEPFAPSEAQVRKTIMTGLKIVKTTPEFVDVDPAFKGNQPKTKVKR